VGDGKYATIYWPTLLSCFVGLEWSSLFLTRILGTKSLDTLAESPNNSIKFSLFCLAKYHKLRTPLRECYNLYSYDIPDLWPHIGSGKTPQEKKKHPFRENKTWRTLQESNRGGSWINVMWPEWSITELHKHFQWVWQDHSDIPEQRSIGNGPGALLFYLLSKPRPLNESLRSHSSFRMLPLTYWTVFNFLFDELATPRDSCSLKSCSRCPALSFLDEFWTILEIDYLDSSRLWTRHICNLWNWAIQINWIELNWIELIPHHTLSLTSSCHAHMV